MIGDNPINDIAGARDAIDAVTIQKLHDGVIVGKGSNLPDATFDDFDNLRNFLKILNKIMRIDNLIKLCEKSVIMYFLFRCRRKYFGKK